MSKDEFRIFYSWQSDTNNKFNQHFIRDCIKDAIKSIKRDDSFTEKYPIKIYEGAKGSTGTQLLGSHIFETIDTCDFFIADLTPVHSLTKEGANNKWVPNPNVAIEFGYALSSLSDAVIMYAMNTAYYPTDKFDDCLPFDLRERRYSAIYSLDDNANKPSEKKRLTSLFREAILPVYVSGPAKRLDIAEKLNFIQKQLEFMPKGAFVDSVEGKESFPDDDFKKMHEDWSERKNCDFPLSPSIMICLKPKGEISRTLQDLQVIRPLGPIITGSSWDYFHNEHGLFPFNTLSVSGFYLNGQILALIFPTDDTCEGIQQISQVRYERDILEMTRAYIQKFDTVQEWELQIKYNLELSSIITSVYSGINKHKGAFITPKANIKYNENEYEYANDLKQTFDYVWQAHGLTGSMNYINGKLNNFYG